MLMNLTTHVWPGDYTHSIHLELKISKQNNAQVFSWLINIKRMEKIEHLLWSLIKFYKVSPLFQI